MIQYTIRTEKIFTCGDGDYYNYPFDTLTAKFRFELSHFNIDGVNYRFDMYKQVNDISFKDAADDLPLFGLDYEKCKFEVLEESKPFKAGGKEVKMFYYPGMTLYLSLPRSPQQPFLKYFLPAVIISIFITLANRIDGIADMLAVESLSLLTYIEMYNSIRGEMPPTLQVSIIEKVVLFYILYSLVPIVDTVGGFDYLADWKGMALWAAITGVVGGYMTYRFVKQMAASKDRKPPKQTKVAGDKAAADTHWS